MEANSDPPPFRQPRWSAGGCVVGLCILGIGAFLWTYRSLITGSTLPSFDGIVGYGQFHYYVRCLATGLFPYWDPYAMGGTYFYPNVTHIGLLDPLVLVSAGAVKVGLPPLRAYVFLRLCRLAVFGFGMYVLASRMTKSRAASLFGAVLLCLGLCPASFYQTWAVDVAWLAPLSMAFYLGSMDSETLWTRRAAEGLALAITTGIAVNIYIPSYYLFNLVCFVLVTGATGFVPWKRALAGIGRGRNLFASGSALFILGLLSAPPGAILWKDLSANGELFPLMRLLQTNNWTYKQLVASQLHLDALSTQFHGGLYTFVPIDSLLGMLFHRSGPSVMFYAGISALWLAFASMARNRRKATVSALILVGLVVATTFSFTNQRDAIPPNSLQRFIDFMFPPLRLFRVREMAASYLGIYIAILAALGLAEFSRENTTLRRVTGFGLFAAAPTGLLAVKLSIAAGVGGSALLSPLDLAVSGCTAVLGLLLWLLRGRAGLDRRGAERRWAAPVLVLLSLVDLVSQNTARSSGGVLMESGSTSYAMVSQLATSVNEGFRAGQFTAYRQPFPSLPLMVANVASALHEKSLISSNKNSALFATKRYYDFTANLPIEAQFRIGGVVFPILRFFLPQDTYSLTQEQSLPYLAEAPDRALSSLLLLENQGSTSWRGEPFALRSAPDEYWLLPWNLAGAYLEFEQRNATLTQTVRKNPVPFVGPPGTSIDVVAFSPNQIALQVATASSGYLLYMDGWSRYWEATDNGSPVAVLPANYNGKAVYLPPGKHEVTMRFSPRHFRLALWAYHTGLVLGAAWLLGLWIASGRRKATGSGAPQPEEG